MNAATFYPLFLKAKKVSIDSRTVEANDIFFAFSGDNFNAAPLAEEVIERGAIAAVVEQKAYENQDKNIFYVPSTLDFLQELAVYHRSKLKIPVVGLTGSNGKTTTKELMHAVLSKKYRVQYTSGNLNNHIGVPLTLLSIKPDHEVAIIEMGANHQKEIEQLCEIAKPTLGYITNFGKAHLEGFGGLEGVIKGKSELYTFLRENGGTVLINADDPLQVERTGNDLPKISFATTSADYVFSAINENNRVGLEYGGQKVLSQLTGAYNFTNLCAAAALGLHFGLKYSDIKSALEGYAPQNMRSQILTKNGKTYVLDTYNANPSSMAESLQNFSNFSGTKMVIMGDMLELGAESEGEHAAIFELAASLGFDEIITVGPHFAAANRGGNSFVNVAALAEYLRRTPFTTENILLKGSRGIALEKILTDI